MKFRNWLLVILGILWLLSGYNPYDRLTWILESILVVIFLPVLYWLNKKIKISTLTYFLVFVFMALHIYGANASYAYAFGDHIWSVLGFSRNMFDRFMHLIFGLIFGGLIFDIFKAWRPDTFWYSAGRVIIIVLALSGAYELLEWAAAVIFAEGASNFIAWQGDVWDAQIDMVLAVLGSVIYVVVRKFTDS